jgi:prepilin-type processing-associated H-X9-DG protein
VADYYPSIWWGQQGRENIVRGQIWPYVRNFEMYLCPTFALVSRRPPAGAESVSCQYASPPHVPYGHPYTLWGTSSPRFDPSTFEPVRGYSLSKTIGEIQKSLYVIDPSTRPWLCDENPWRQLYRYPQLDQGFGINNPHLAECDAPAEFHEGKANCVFGDGHVTKITPPEMLDTVIP